MKLRGPLLLLLLVPMLAGFDCGSSGDTKLDQCVKLGKAYCQQERAVGCLDPTDPCTSENCYDIFDGKCEATPAEKDKVDHDIKMIIQSKTSCDGLRSVDDYLLGTVMDMASSQCVNGSSYDTVGEMCERMINAYCAKVIELNCSVGSEEVCVSMSWASGEASLGYGFNCTSPDDTRAPVPAQIAGYNEASDEIKNANTCD